MTTSLFCGLPSALHQVGAPDGLMLLDKVFTLMLTVAATVYAKATVRVVEREGTRGELPYHVIHTCTVPCTVYS